MMRRDRSNNEIRRMGEKALSSIRMSDEEIEGSVTGPQLFDAIRASIRTEQVHLNKPSSFAAKWSLQWRTAVVFGALAIAAVGIFTAAYFLGRTDQPTNAALATQRDVAPPATMPDVIVEPDLPKPRGTERTVAATAPPTRRESITAVKAGYEKRQARSKPERYSEFYEIGYAGDIEESKENGRLVRVKLPRTSLYAMGIKIPEENLSETIKADILIGEDGMTKAIRLVD